ncbi:hypothetical protein DL768_005674 [Monosporascus sp. mg162]|nr:hypothetical protein DL768_005674 [Monosporascus sp. mg162]
MGAEFGSSVFRAELAKAEREMRGRVDAYTAAWASGNIDAVLAYFVEEGLDYSDYGLMVLHMDKKALADHFRHIGAAYADMRFETRDVRGALDFCVWEYVIEFTLLEDVQHCPYKKGDRGKAFCAATIRWRDGKICGNNDYCVWGISGVQV